jgi:hypothetical protein
VDEALQLMLSRYGRYLGVDVAVERRIEGATRLSSLGGSHQHLIVSTIRAGGTVAQPL